MHKGRLRRLPYPSFELDCNGDRRDRLRDKLRDAAALSPVTLAGVALTKACLTNAALTTLLSPTNFGSSGAATFTYGSGTSLRTFIAFNDGSAGFNAITDAVVEITGYRFATGFSSLSEISIV